MAADAKGNDVSAVPIPIGGLIAFADYSSANVLSDSAFKAASVTLPGGFGLLGLVKQDGAPQHSREDGDRLEFWQVGYTSAGDGKRAVSVTLAENNDRVLKLTEGKAPDANGIIYVDSSLPDARWIIFGATQFKNGTEERYHGVATVTAVEVDQDERGAVRGKKVTLTWQEDPLFTSPEGRQAPYKLWVGSASGVATTPVVTEASPAGATAGAMVAISGTGFVGATAVKFGSTNATVFNIVSDTQIQAAMPPGTAGSAAIVVSKGTVTSNSFAYTRG